MSNEMKDWMQEEINDLRARVQELEYAIREHRERVLGSRFGNATENEELWSVLGEG